MRSGDRKKNLKRQSSDCSCSSFFSSLVAQSAVRCISIRRSERGRSNLTKKKSNRKEEQRERRKGIGHGRGVSDRWLFGILIPIPFQFKYICLDVSPGLVCRKTKRLQFHLTNRRMVHLNVNKCLIISILINWLRRFFFARRSEAECRVSIFKRFAKTLRN